MNLRNFLGGQTKCALLMTLVMLRQEHRNRGAVR
jgi:hypothetical protein